MTQDGFAGAERIGATIDVLADALLGADDTHYPASSLTAFDRSAHPSADALFGLRLSPAGPGLLTVRGLGTVVEAGTARTADDPGAPTAELFARYGGTDVFGLPAEAVSPERVAVPVRPESAEGWMRPEFPAAVARFAAERPVAVPEELATGAGVEVRLVVPSVFHPLTVRGDRQRRAAHLAEVAEELHAGSRAPRRQDWSVLTGLLAQPAAAAGVVFAGVAALRVDGRPSRASLVVSLTSHPRQISELSAELADTRPQAEVWTVLIPAGPTAVLVESRIAPVPPLLLPAGSSVIETDAADNTVVSVLQAFLPLPDGVSVLTVQLGTAQTEDWELYAATFAEILASIQVGWDGTRAALPQLPVQQPVAHEPIAHEPVAQQAVAQQPVAQAPVIPPVPSMPPTVPAQAPAVAAPVAEQRPKGVKVNIPPPDFNPFAPPRPAEVPAQAEAPAAEGTPRKGVKVNIPPADFNPFAAPAPPPATPAAAAPAPQPAAPAAPAAADPFGTVTVQQATDPFGTVTSAQPAAPVRVPAPTPPPAAPPTAAAPAPGKGVKVNVPPPDFNPFAPPAPATAADDAAEGEDAPAPRKGVKVNIPPADFNPFAAPAPPPAIPAAAAPAAEPEPPAYSPFG